MKFNLPNRRLALVQMAVAAFICGANGPAQAQAESIVISSTTSTEQSGLFGHLMPVFTQATGIATKVVALGTGQALDVGRRGDADVLLVQINPIEHPDLPDTAPEIMERMNEVTFNASLLGELRAIDFVRRLLAEGRLDPQHYKSMRMHRIDGGRVLAPFGDASKSRADMAFVRQLFELGRTQGKQWLRRHRRDVGVQHTLHLTDNH